ncbi:MAG TPA: carbohydrate kinase family protein [Terriglobales bacterium]|jgi:sugar/nucleoside kinase (ribokinase family)|nr:carbohydrate kinase family protein [Terriglobales bacterium]
MAKLDIAIVGEINLDLILYGLPERMPTERELLASGFAITLGSSSAILAHNLAALGSQVGFVTKVGGDSFGGIAMERLRERGVDMARVAHGAKSGVTIILPHETQRHILTYPGTISELRFEDIDLDYLASARHFHMSSLFLQRELLPHVPELFRRMKSAGLTTSLDTNDDPEDRWQGGLSEILPHVDIILPNEREAMKIAGTDDSESALSRIAQKVKTVVVKMGARGAVAIQGGRRLSAPAVPVKVVDPIGAGDSFDAGFLHQFLRGADITKCLTYGNSCGAFSTTDCGGTEAFRDAARMEEFFHGHDANNQ